MTLRETKRKLTTQWRRQTLGALLTALFGLGVFYSRLGQGVDHWSYDSLFLTGADAAPEEVMIVRMDETSHHQLRQPDRRWWDRGLHARLLKQLTEDRARMVVFDVPLVEPGDALTNQYLADAIRANGHVVLAGDVNKDLINGIASPETPLLPLEIFRQAAAGVGIDQIDQDGDFAVRRFYTGTGVFPSLAWAAAEQCNAPVTRANERVAFFTLVRWLRYYDPGRSWVGLGYASALEKPRNFFRDKIVFVGGEPGLGYVGERKDEFATPFSRWGRPPVAGVDIHATMFLNLLHGDWLTRLAPGWEFLVLLGAGVSLGIGLSAVDRPWLANGVALLAILLLAGLAMALARTQSIWFGWLTVAGVEVPVAWAWAMLSRQRSRRAQTAAEPVPIQFHSPPSTPHLVSDAGAAMSNVELRIGDSGMLASAPPVSGHTLLRRIGAGSYGEVWLARDVIGSLHAAKIIRRGAFQSAEPFEREFRGMQKFTPISRSHPGLVHVLHVERNDAAGYFYYIMEAADDVVAGQKIDPLQYVPKSLATELARRKRLPVEECLQLGLDLAAALDYLHRQQLVHRDLKPSNIIFVDGKPKLADIGLVTDLGPAPGKVTYVGTTGYLAPEGPGTAAADVYSLGKVIYEAAMGRDCSQFPEMPTTLVEHPAEMAPLLDLNEVILNACAPAPERYQTAGELHAALKLLEERLRLPKEN